MHRSTPSLLALHITLAAQPSLLVGSGLQASLWVGTAPAGSASCEGGCPPPSIAHPSTNLGLGARETLARQQERGGQQGQALRTPLPPSQQAEATPVRRLRPDVAARGTASSAGAEGRHAHFWGLWRLVGKPGEVVAGQPRVSAPSISTADFRSAWTRQSLRCVHRPVGTKGWLGFHRALRTGLREAAADCAPETGGASPLATLRSPACLRLPQGRVIQLLRPGELASAGLSIAEWPDSAWILLLTSTPRLSSMAALE